MRPVSLCVCLIMLGASAFGQKQSTRFEDLTRQFDYEHEASLDVRELSRENRDGVTLIDLTYASPLGGRVPAYMVVPAGRGPFAAILYGHWMMPGSPMRSRREFLDEAIVMARSGAVSLLIDATLVRPGFVEEKDELRAQAQSAEAARQQVVDLRRGVDLLIARRDVDPTRMAYVGHSFGAHVGGILSAVEKRINSFVLMAGVFADEEYVFDPDNPEMLKVRERIGDQMLRDFFRKYAFDDPLHFVGHSGPAHIFLQFGRQDKPIPLKLARRFYDLFPGPKKIAFYDAGHALDRKARMERVKWLAGRLSLRPVDKAALGSIPDLK